MRESTCEAVTLFTSQWGVLRYFPPEKTKLWHEFSYSGLTWSHYMGISAWSFSAGDDGVIRQEFSRRIFLCFVPAEMTAEGLQPNGAFLPFPSYLSLFLVLYSFSVYSVLPFCFVHSSSAGVPNLLLSRVSASCDHGWIPDRWVIVR